jgi:hypothetical protein
MDPCILLRVYFSSNARKRIRSCMMHNPFLPLDQRDLPNNMIIFSYLPLNPSSQSSFFSRSFFVKLLEICQLLVVEKWTWCLGKDSKKLGNGQ